MQIYLSELRTVKNNVSGVTRYYIKKCDTWTRVTHADYLERMNESYRSDCYLTKTKGHLVYNDCTVYFKH